MERFYLCLVDGTPSCQHHHATLAEARAEAERLAIQTGKGVTVLAAIERCKPARVTWEKIENPIVFGGLRSALDDLTSPEMGTANIGD